MKRYVQHLFLHASSLVWVVPFLAFCTGYAYVQFFMAEPIIPAPDLVGKEILQASKICSQQKLNLRIIGEKEIADATPGTIIKQNPLPQKQIKTHQSLFIVITKQPDPVVAPDLLNKHHDEIELLCKEHGIKNRVYFLPGNYPAGKCFAQMPLPGKVLEGKKMSCYICTGKENQYLFPDFTNTNLHDVADFLQNNAISFDVFCKDQKLKAPYQKPYQVIHQKPLPGTFITQNNKLYVQLQVA